jgi:tryptophanyl-tRNA synthetase
MKSRVVFTAIQPTGSVHLGNFLGSIEPLSKMEGAPLYCMLADWHALTDRYKVDHSASF